MNLSLPIFRIISVTRSLTNFINFVNKNSEPTVWPSVLTPMVGFLRKEPGQQCSSAAHGGSMSLGKAVCLHSLNPIKTSSRISSHIPHISVYCSWAFKTQDRRLGFILKHTWDWQTNKQAVLRATRGDGGHRAGGTLPVSLSWRATNVGWADSLGWRTDWPARLAVHSSGYLWIVTLKLSLLTYPCILPSFIPTSCTQDLRVLLDPILQLSFAKAGWHPGQVASSSQNDTERQTTSPTQQFNSHAQFWILGWRRRIWRIWHRESMQTAHKKTPGPE